MRVTEHRGELRELEDDELATKLREAKEELFNLRFQSATGQLESHGRLRAVRKDIARIYTVLQERELGIVEDPDLAVEDRKSTRLNSSHANISYAVFCLKKNTYSHQILTLSPLLQ